MYIFALMKNLYIYNPTCDMAVENGTLSYMPPASLRKFEYDIAPIMSFSASQDDVLISDNESIDVFSEFWSKLGFPQPRHIKTDQIDHINSEYNICPWGWSPVITHRFKRFIKKSYDFHEQSTRRLFSRQTSVDITIEFNKLFSHLNPFIHQPVAPFIIKETSQLPGLLEQHPNGLVLKTLFSSSGRGLLFLKSQSEITNHLPWIEARIKGQGYLIGEPFYRKIQDASLQFMIEGNDYKFLGLNFFDADPKGHFQKEHIGRPDSIASLLPPDTKYIDQVTQQLVKAMQAIGLHKKYNGSLGFDTIFFKDDNDTIKFHPLIEVNLRYNMGLINLFIQKRIDKNSKGNWQIESFKKGEAYKFFKEQMKAHPVQLKNGKITKGFIPLSPFGQDQQFAAWGIIHEPEAGSQRSLL